MTERLERILKKFGKGLITAGLVASSLFLGCSDENPVTNSKSTPTPPPTPKTNTLPKISSSPPTSISENQNYSYQVMASDADKDTLKYSLTKRPPWLSINSSTGLIRGTAPEVIGNEVHEVALAVSDGKAFVQQNYNLNVQNLSNTYVLSPTQVGELTNVDSVSLSFSKAMNFSPGDILAADISDKTPDGLLRRVNSTSSDKKIIHTQNASLEEAIKSSNFVFTGKINSSGSTLNSFKQGVSETNSTSAFDFSVDINSAVIYDFDGNSSTTNDRLTASGNISFSFDYELSGKVNNHSLDELIFKLIATEKCNLKVKSPSSFGWFSKYIPVGEYSFKSFVIGYTTTIPPIPIIVKPKIEVGVEFSGGMKSLELGASQDAVFTVGVSYQNGQWKPITSLTNNFQVDPVNLSSPHFGFIVRGGPTVKFPLYNIAGPKGKLSGKLEIDASPEAWSFYGGLEATLGVEMKMFKHVFVDFEAKVLDYKKVIASGIFPTDLDTLVIQPGPEGKDAYVRRTLWPDQSETYSGFGNDSLMEVEREHISNHAVDEEGLLQFTTPSLPPNAKLSSAKLKVYGYAYINSLGATPTITLSKLLGQWEEASVKWNTKPSSEKILDKDFVNKGVKSWYEFEVTSAVQAWINGEPNYGFGFSTSQNTTNGFLYSSDNTNVTKRPILEILYVP